MNKNSPDNQEHNFIIEYNKIMSDVPVMISTHKNHLDLRQPSFLEEIDCTTTYEVSCSTTDIK